MSELVIAALEEGRADLFAAVDGLSDAQAVMRPAGNRWSALEIVEHLVIVEARFQGWINAGKELDAPLPDRDKEASLTNRVTDRTMKADAPEAVRPAGRFTTLAEGQDAFRKARDESVRMAQERGAELYSVGAEHPRFGPLNGIEVLYLLAGHGRRHATQIRENRVALGH